MASEGTSTVPRMASFKRALLGYRREEVDAAMAARDAAISAVEHHASTADAELASLSGMVIEREREIRGLSERLREADERHERSIDSLRTVSERLEAIEAQARGQATRIRMKALREAVEVSRRTQDLADAHDGTTNGAAPTEPTAEAALGQLFEGLIKLEIGPLGDFSQLVGFENAVGRLGASEISVERFSEGRATLSMHLDEPVDLLRELEENAPFDFNIRRTADDNLVLDMDEDQDPEQRAA
jgi:regulator of protease activity HflC (stomatin/prohibitin superfamily)